MQKALRPSLSPFLGLVLSFLTVGGALAASPLVAPVSVVPKVDLSFWNQPDIESYNNCYNYATNRRTDSYAQPGEASGLEYKSFTCADVYSAAKADLGLVPTPFVPFGGKNDELLVALTVAPGDDFHWYRRDDDGFWTNKPGGTPASNLDDSGKTITSPETADRGDYTDFCGYFRVKNYPLDATEQNGGYVRIGNMQNLPDTTTSSVRVLLYSGRRDPEIKLRDFLAGNARSPELDWLRRNYAAQARIPATAVPPLFRRLGYRGILIRDTEGLIFPRGTTVQIRGGVSYAELPKWSRLEGFLSRSTELTTLERGLYRYVLKTAH